ncbi:hypothetical protein BV22DRAFT_974595, partial [Leucogyrophana mollusca]
IFTTSTPRCVQGLTKTCARQKLSKEAQAEINARRREASTKFRTDIDVWKKIDEATENIAAENNKSIQRVQHELHVGRALLHVRQSKASDWNAFCWKKNQENNGDRKSHLTLFLQPLIFLLDGTGKDVLLTLVHDLGEEYVEYRENKLLGRRISTKSKVNNVTLTMKSVESQLNSLNSCTGAEMILFTTCGTTDLPLRGLAFATPGIEDFMPIVMNMDTQDFVTKMEGFAIQGIKGAAKNHQKHISQVRAQIRNEIQKQLREITGHKEVRMQWKLYFQNIIDVYQVKIVGWPDNVPFGNLSQVSSALPDLQALLRKWQSGAIRWEHIDDDELARLREKRNQQLESGEIQDHCCHVCSDKGKSRKKGGATRTKEYKSAETIADSDND